MLFHLAAGTVGPLKTGAVKCAATVNCTRITPRNHLRVVIMHSRQRAAAAAVLCYQDVLSPSGM
jgi:hypothetical protein